MPKVIHIQSAFTSGEISPRLEGRVDLEIYQQALKTCENFIVYRHGGAVKRTGTKFVAEGKDSTKAVRLIPFEFSTTQAYVIEVGEEYFRFYRDQGQIVDSSGNPYEIETPYQEADLFELKFAQDADTMYIVHPEYAPRKLTRTGHTAWTLTAVTFTDGPYLDEDESGTTITPSGATGDITLTASASLFTAGHVGGTWRIKHTTEWGDVTITSLGSPAATVANATVNNDLDGSGTPAAAWRKAAWDGVEGYPGAVAFYEQRLDFAGSAEDPQALWGSVAGDYEDMAPSAADGTVTDANAFTYILAGQQVNAIRWLEPGLNLVGGTTGGTWRVRSSATDEPITPTSINARLENNYGAANIQPVTVGQALIYVQRMQKKVRELLYDYGTDAWDSKDLTIRAEHITGTGDGIVDMAFQMEPDPIIWCVRADGQLLGCTYDRLEKVVAWHRHTTSGASGLFESVCTVPGDTRDEVWVVVNRTIGEATVRYVEYFQQPYVTQTEQYFVDCGLTGSFGSPVTTVSGLTHLAGETVQVLADGAVQSEKVVSSGGSITLDIAAEEVHVGLGFDAVLNTVRIEPGLDQTVQGQTKRIHKVILRVYNSPKAGIDVGPSSTQKETTFGRVPADEMDSPPALVTEDIEVLFPGDYEKPGEVYIKSSQPVGLTILALIAELNIYGGG